MESIINSIDSLVKLEKKGGKMGTVVGLLIIAVVTLSTVIAIALLVEFNINVVEWVINQLW